MSFQPVMQAREYNSNSFMQEDAIRLAFPNLLEAAKRAPLPTSGVLTIAEFGASQGKNSVAPLRLILGELNRRVAAKPGFDAKLDVTIVHEDLPKNDFNSLFELIENPETSYLTPEGADKSTSTASSRSGEGRHGATAGEPHCPEAESGPSAVSSDADVSVDADADAGMGAYSHLSLFPLATGRTFYKRILPKGTVHIALAFSCMHFLSRKPLVAPDSHFNHLTRDPKAYAAFNAQSRADLSTFLDHRHRELIHRGALVFHVPVHNLGEVMDKDALIASSLLRSVVQSLIDEGLMREEERSAISSYDFIPNYETLRQLLQEQEAAGRFTVESMELLEIPNRALSDFKAGKITVSEFADLHTRIWRAVFWPSYMAGLTKTRSEEEAAAILTELFRRCTECTSKNTEHMTYKNLRFAYVYLTKV